MASEKKDTPPSVALPIDAHVARIVASVRRGNVVLVAEPGAGKTTRVPRALLEAGVAKERIVVLEPRRLPTRLAAERVAFELGEKVGERIGYQVRFDSQTGRDTRVIFVTEGILTRRLASDPSLQGRPCRSTLAAIVYSTVSGNVTVSESLPARSVARRATS